MNAVENTIAQTLFGSHLNRCRRLDIVGPVDPSLPIDKAAPSLQELRVTCEGFSDVEGSHSIISVAAPNLRKLLVTMPPTFPIAIEPHHVSPSLLTYLTINANIEDTSAWALFSECRRLIRLRWHANAVAPEPTIKIGLPEL